MHLEEGILGAGVLVTFVEYDPETISQVLADVAFGGLLITLSDLTDLGEGDGGFHVVNHEAPPANSRMVSASDLGW